VPLAFSYCRTSTARQARAERSGIERQEDALARWLADHPGYALQEALVDAGVSAGRGKNRTTGALARFINGGRTGAIPPGSCLVVESMSRFTREAERSALETLLRDVWGQGLAVAFCSDGGTVLTAELIDQEPHRLFGLLGSIGQARREWEERSRRSRGASRKRERLQDEGLRPPGRRPYWINRSDSGELSIDPTNRKAIDRAVELAIGGLGMTLIAEQLNAEGFPPPPTQAHRNQYRPAAGRRWAAGQVSRLLRHPALVGTLQRQGSDDIPGYYPEMVTLQRWEQLRASVDRRNVLKGKLRGKTYRCQNLFQTLLRCGCCGGPIGYTAPAARARKGHPGYSACRHGSRGLNGCTMRGNLEYDAVEAHCLGRLGRAEWEALLHRPDDDQKLLALELAVAQLQIQERQQLAQLERAQERAEAAWLADAGEARLATIEGALARLRGALAVTTADLAGKQQKLAMAVARPRSTDQAAAMRERVAEFARHIEQADGPQRVKFNRWLLAREPVIEFRLHPEARIELLIGGESLGVESILPLSDRMALRAGRVGRRLLEEKAVVGGVTVASAVLTDAFEQEQEARDRLHEVARQDQELVEGAVSAGWVSGPEG
jgi:hypothetical protein